RSRPIRERRRFRSRHVGFEAAEPGEASRRGLRGCLDEIGDFLARAAVMAGARELAGRGAVRHCLACLSSGPIRIQQGFRRLSNPFETLSPRPVILQVVPALETGGAERTTVDVARAVVAAGGRAIVASRGGRMVAELAVSGVEHIDMAVHSKNPVVMGLNVERLARVISREGVDLVHARSRAPAWSALAAARRAKIPFVTTDRKHTSELQ